MVLVLHVAVIALVLYSRTRAPAAAMPGLIAFNVSANDAHEQRAASSTPMPRAASPTATQPPLAQPPITLSPLALPAPLIEMARIDVMASLANMMPVADAVAQETPAAVQGGCDLTPRVQEALRQDAAILHALPEVPAARRSIANAIVVWNAVWIDPGSGAAQAPLSAVRQTIEQVVAAASDDCRNQVQAGPRLVYLPDDAGKTTVLAIGSGQWRWQQLANGALSGTGNGGRVAEAAPLPAARLPRLSETGQTPNVNALLASLIGQRSSAAKPFYP